jgi:hypothetical protein
MVASGVLRTNDLEGGMMLLRLSEIFESARCGRFLYVDHQEQLFSQRVIDARARKLRTFGRQLYRQWCADYIRRCARARALIALDSSKQLALPTELVRHIAGFL